MSKIVLKAGKERSLYRLHPWVFSGAIAKIKGDVQEGDVVQVYNSDDEYLATGHYQIGSIAVRVLTFKEEEIGYNFWVERIRQAYLTRVAIGLATNPNNNVYRLVHGEGRKEPFLLRLDLTPRMTTCTVTPTTSRPSKTG